MIIEQAEGKTKYLRTSKSLFQSKKSKEKRKKKKERKRK